MSGIIDLHCDTILNCWMDKESLRSREGHIDLERLKRGGAAAQCFAIFLATGAGAQRRDITQEPYELLHLVYEYYLGQLAANSDLISPALCPADIEKNQREGKLSAILTVEDCVFLDGKIERVDEMEEMGVRMACLLWNYENSLGYPNNDESERHLLGLKPFGIEAVERMNEKGIIVDVSHLSEGGFYDVAKHSRKPFAASHSCARALCGHRRNLTDGQLKTIGDTGSVAGVNFYSRFLTEGSDYTSNERIVEHAVYIANKAGIEALALGSDFDGIDCELEMKDYAGYPRLIGALQKHFTDDQIDLICEKNFMRVFRDCAGEGGAGNAAGSPAERLFEACGGEYKNPALERID